ncbi:MAG: sigma-70 family RNA polymerase sigma factor [Acidobacteria bacterium]|nr:sigma-70 family RNA polymerase sigma factor [Acidobacteriota bacterium]
MSSECERLLLDNLPLVERAVAFVCRRQRFSAEMAEEFSAEVNLKLVEDDYRVLRRFEGRSSLSTYLVAVVQHFALDYRDRLQGRWRPSARASALGEDAVRLEELVHRDGRSREEALTILAGEGRPAPAGKELDDLCAPRAPRRPELSALDPEAAGNIPVESTAEDALQAVEARPGARRLSQVLDRAVDALRAEDRLAVRLRYGDGLPVVDVARVLGREPRPLYRRFEKILARLRRALAAGGIGPDASAAVLAFPESPFSMEIFRGRGGKPPSGPSEGVNGTAGPPGWRVNPGKGEP